MDFVFDLLIPANTLKATPAELPIDVGVGVIHLVEIEFRPGPNYMVYAAVRWGVHQVWPTNPDGAYRSDSRVYSMREHYRRIRGAPSLVIQGWSPGTAYAHAVQFRFSVLPLNIMEPWRVQQGLLDYILQRMGVRPKGAKE